MALHQAELWIETRPCELRLDCGLARYHIHVSDQIFLEMEELDEAYGRDGWEVKQPEVEQFGKIQIAPVGTALDKLKGWVTAGFVSTSGAKPVSDHRNHVHVAIGPGDPNTPVKAGDLMGVDPATGNVRLFQSGDKPAGFATGGPVSDHGTVRAIDLNVSGSWQVPSHEEEVARLRQLRGIHRPSR